VEHGPAVTFLRGGPVGRRKRFRKPSARAPVRAPGPARAPGPPERSPGP
jgi:hypothetical protein